MAEGKRRQLAEVLAAGKPNLSAAQQRLWILNALNERALAAANPFHLTAAYRLEGELDIPALELALGQIVTRHESLRTSFRELEGVPVRVVQDASSVALPLVDLSDHELERLVEAEASRPFDLAQSPLVRVTLVRMAPGEHALLVTLHELVSDRRSLEVFFRELGELYALLAAGREPEVPPLPVQFADHALRERERLEGGELEPERAYWLRELAAQEPLELPTDCLRPPLQSFRGAVERLTLDRDVLERLGRLSEESGGSLFTTLLAAFHVLLRRVSGQTDVAVGTPVAESGDFARVIGPLSNTVVVRLQEPGDPPFRSFLERIRERWSAARAHGELPFEALLDELRPERDLSRTPLFQVLFELRDQSAPDGPFGSLALRPVEVDVVATKFDLSLVCERRQESLRLCLEYNRDLFEAATARRILKQLARLLDDIALDPERPLSELRFFAEEERARLEEWSRGAEVELPEARLHELFERQVEQSPDALALVFEEEGLSYAELNRRANRLAHHLRSRGVGRESIVGIHLARSLNRVVAVLAVSKAGAAYLPLEPGYPRERLVYMLEQCGSRLVISDRTVEANTDVVRLDELDLASQPDMNLTTDGGPADLAYVIYTSGSTGRPKGVAVEHRGVVNYVLWAIGAYEIDKGKGVPLHSSLAFDLTVTGLFGPLFCGRTVYLLGEDELGLASLAEALSGEDFSFVKVTPAHLELLSRWLEPDHADHVHRLVSGGDLLQGEDLAFWAQHAPDLPIDNEYGPTETVVGCTYQEFTVSSAPFGPLPIGRPIPNVRMHVLDSSLRPVPIGVRGELYVGGVQVARGYVGQPAETAEKFVPDPFVPGGRLYRTGDLVKWQPDGNLFFLGRADQQVKIRGYRIELEEIEATLREQHGVRDAAVSTRTVGERGPLLVGYVVPDGTETVRPLDHLNELRDRLPEYMIPEGLVVVDELPLTTNGKVDFERLPPPSFERPELDTEFEEPRAPLEREIAGAFADALRIDRVGRNDNFFDLGAHSLLVVELAARLSRAYDMDLRIEQFFEDPTPAGIAKIVEIYRTEGRETASALPIRQLEEDAVLPEDIDPKGLPLANVDAPRRILLTGATGFVGAFILRQLLEQTDAEVVCLVRAANDAEAFARLEETLRHYLVWDESAKDRITTVAGDLTKPLLGLSESRFAQLAADIDVIYHSGALINFVYPYAALRPTNRHGTVEVLRLACTTQKKTVHYLSTIDVFLTGESFDVHILEEDAPRPTEYPSGYVQSKWVGERLVVAARDRGLPVCVFRPWLVLGNAETGVCHTTDYMCVVLKGCIQLGMAPDHGPSYLNIMPVDWIAKAIVHISRKPDAIGRYFNLGNPHYATINEGIGWTQSFGYDVDIVPYDVWREQALRVGPSHPLSKVGGLFRPAGVRDWPVDKILMTVDFTNTLKALEGTGIVCPPPEGFVFKSLQWLVDVGFLPTPEEQRRAKAAAAPIAAPALAS